MSERQVASWPKDRPPRWDKSGRRYRVRYDLAYDGGGAAWDGYYRTRLGARVAVWWNRHISSWGGTADLFDRSAQPEGGYAVSVPDREQLIRQIADDIFETVNRDDIWTVLDALDRLGYSVTPAESPAEAPVRPQERSEGSEATPTDEMAVLDAVSGWRAAIESRNQGAVDDALVHLARVSAAWRAEGCSGRRQSVDDMLAEAAGRGWTLLNCISDRRGYRLCLEATGVVGPDVDGAGPTLYAAAGASDVAADRVHRPIQRSWVGVGGPAALVLGCPALQAGRRNVQPALDALPPPVTGG